MGLAQLHHRQMRITPRVERFPDRANVRPEIDTCRAQGLIPLLHGDSCVSSVSKSLALNRFAIVP